MPGKVERAEPTGYTSYGNGPVHYRHAKAD
jgi:hypothetical protein